MRRLIDGDALIRKFKTASPMAIDGRARQMVEEMPTIEPERKTGRWIHKGGGSFICSDCGEMVGLNTYRSERAGEIFRYCPHCGAYMRGDTE